jgi:hypothetical protein
MIEFGGGPIFGRNGIMCDIARIIDPIEGAGNGRDVQGISDEDGQLKRILILRASCTARR